jgi:hypothetical protein
MKRLTTTSMLALCIICTLLYSCSSGPSDQEVIALVTPNGRVLKMEVQKQGKSKKIGETKVFSFTVYMKFIQPGMRFGYIAECPTNQCFNDIEYENIKEFLIRKNEWDKWEIYESRMIEKKEIQRYWRPTSQTIEEFYKDIK